MRWPKGILCSFLLLFSASVTARGQVNLYVDSSVAVSGAGTSWATAYKTLNEALNVANNASAFNACTIRVARGTYYPTGSQSGTNRDSTFAFFRGGLRVYGGYPAGGGTRNVAVNPTVLSGAIGQPSDSSDNSYHVVVMADIPINADSAILDGLHIVRGTANATTAKVMNGVNVLRHSGGGIAAYEVSEKVLINNCTIANNSVVVNGGGLFGDVASYAVRNCRLVANHAGVYGGGAYCTSGAPIFWATDFIGNSSIIGGGLYALSTILALDSCDFSDNAALGNGFSSGGGGLYVGSLVTNTTFSHCTFTNNLATAQGGAVFAAAGSGSFTTHTFLQCSFTDNRAILGGSIVGRGGAIQSASGGLLLDSCSFTGNRTTGSTTSAGFGGAVNATGGTGSGCTILDCSFTADTSGIGGALNVDVLVPLTVTNTVFAGNHAVVTGGGATVNSSSATLNNCDFTGNSAGSFGGGLRCNGTFLISHSRFRSNAAGAEGGALVVSGSSPAGSRSVFSCLFSGNKAGSFGGAVIVGGISTSLGFGNCTFAGDSAANGNALYSAAPTVSMLNSIVWDGAGTSIDTFGTGNLPAVSQSIVQGGYPGTGNTTGNPLFLTPLPSSAAPTQAGDYRLSGCSPAINSGVNAGGYAGQVDAAGNPRLYGTTIDRGAYELQAPAGNVITGSPTVCAGGTIQLSNAAVGGAWSSSAPLVASVGATGLVTAQTAGVAMISYSIPSPLGICVGTATKTITVDAVPVVAPITGPASVCTGASITLANATPSGTWSSGNSGLATVNASGVVTGIAAGISTIRYKVTSANGTCADSVSKIVSVNATSTQTVSAALCRGTAYAFGTQVLTSPGTYTSIFANAAGCDSTVTLNLSNGSPDTTVAQVGTLLTAAASGAAYQWVRCEPNGTKTPLPGATAQSFTATADGQYAVVLTKNGCTDTSACHTVNVLGVTTLMHGVVRAFPIPTTGRLIVVTEALTVHSISILNTLGQEVRRIRPTGSVSELDLTGNAPGIYFLRITNDATERFMRVVLVRP